MSHLISNNDFNTFSLPPLPLNDVPPLPSIDNPALYELVTSHSSLTQAPRDPCNLDPTEMAMNYEKLEHVGDALLGAMVVVILHDLFPLLSEGGATLLKSYLVSNATLAQISDAYGLPDKLQGHKATILATRKQVKTRASVFEAWLAGVYYSLLNELPGGASSKSEVGIDSNQKTPEDHNANGIGPKIDESAGEAAAEMMEEGVEVNVKAQEGEPNSEIADCVREEAKQRAQTACLPSKRSHEGANATPNIAAEGQASMADEAAQAPGPAVTAEVFSPTATTASMIPSTPSFDAPLRYRWLAMLVLDDWLRPLFTPLAHFTMEQLRAERIRKSLLPRSALDGRVPAEIAAEDEKAMGHLSLLNMMGQQEQFHGPFYEQHQQDDGQWKVTCRVVDAVGVEVVGEGVRANIKAAKAVAAYRICQTLGINSDS